MRYFTLYGRGSQCQNKLQEGIDSLLASHSNRILDDEQSFETLKERIEDEVRKLHERHPRCKPVEVKVSKHGIATQSLHIWLDFARLYIYAANN